MNLSQEKKSLMVLGALLLIATRSQPSQAEDAAQFGASIFLGGPWDWEKQGSGRSRCFEMVDNAKQYNINYVQFVPTLYWVDAGPRQPWPEGFDSSCSNADLGTYYCYGRFNSTEVSHWCYVRQNGQCNEVSDAEMQSFKDNLGSCMKYAASRGLNLAVNARVDDGKSAGGWRNTLDFNPVQKYGKYSYEEAIVNPIADLLGAAAAEGSVVQFTPQGEMGATVWFFPTEWKDLVSRVRGRIEGIRGAGGRAGPVEVGLGVNNNKACGCEYVGIVDAYEFIGNLSATFDPSKYPSIPAVKEAYLEADYLSVSAYIPMPSPTFDLCDMEGLMERMDLELAVYGMSLKEFTSAGTEIVYGEFGIGGGVNSDGNQPAQTAEEAAYTPFFGIGGSYACSRDPFDGCDPDAPNEVRDYRRYFYSKVAEYFKSDGCTYDPRGIKVAYVWGTGSWDVFAIYPGDRTSEGSWADPEVIATINGYNEWARQR